MTEHTPIPSHLSAALFLRGRHVLERAGIQSCEELLALGEQDMFQFAGCGRKTVDGLKRLQRRVLQAYPDLIAHYVVPLPARPSEPASPPASHSNRRKEPATDPPAPPSCEPADWSILSRTLPDLFQFPDLPPGGEPAPEATIATLELPAADLLRLRSLAVFPEDPIHLLGSLSMGYLSRAGLGDTFFSIIRAALARLHGLSGPVLPSLALIQVRDTSPLVGIAPELLDLLAVPDFPCAFLPNNGTGSPPRAVPLSALTEITERTVVRRLGLNCAALRAIAHLWLWQKRAQAVEWSARAGLPYEAYRDFHRLANTYLDLALGAMPNKERIDTCRRILGKRLRLADGRKWPLRELGKCEGVTGERIRQLESRMMAVLQSPEMLQHLDYLWHLLNQLLVSGGGACYLSELAGALTEILGWPSTPGEALGSLVELSPDYQVIWDAPIRVVLAGACCARCATIGVSITKAMAATPKGAISFDAALEMARQSCRDSRCPERDKTAAFSRSILDCAVDTTPGVSVRGGQLVAPHVQSREGSHRHRLEQILFKAGKGMHYKHIQLEFNRTLPAFSLNSKRVYLLLQDSPSAVLWGAGTFIHRDLVSVPMQLIAEIQEGLDTRLESRDAPYLCLNGTIFDQYRKRLFSEDVHTPLALYSCMRLVGSATLDFSEYPYVQRKGHPAPRPPLSAVLEDFVLSRPGPVPRHELTQYGLNVLGMVSWQFTIHLKRASGVLHIGGNKFLLHRSRLSLVLDALTEITAPLKDFDGGIPISREWLYHSNHARCNEAGIHDAACLISLIKHFFPKESVFDKIASERSATETTKPGKKRTDRPLRERVARPYSKSALRQMEIQLANSTSPCKTRELFDQVKDRVKSADHIVYAFLKNKVKFLWYTKDSLIPRQALGWDAGKQAVIEEYAAGYLEQRTRSGKPFGLCSELIRGIAGSLPAIAEHILWTPVLLQQLLGSGKRFVAFGRQRDIFVAADNPHGIATVDDIIFHSLVHDYGGVAPKRQFIAAMRKSSLASSKLTRLLKGRDNRVTVDDSFIAAAGLEAATRQCPPGEPSHPPC